MINLKAQLNGRSISAGMVATREQGEKRIEFIMENFDHLAVLVNTYMAAVNTLAGEAIFNAKTALSKQKNLYRFDVKHYAREAERQYTKYERAHTRNFGKKHNMFLDYLSSVEDIMGRHIKNLHLSLWQVLTKKNQSNAELKSLIETAWVMTKYACEMFDRMMKEAYNKTHFDYTPYFINARLTSVFHYWDLLENTICKVDRGTGTVDFQEDDNCKLAFRIIETQLMSEDTINRAGFEAIKQNIDLVGGCISEEEYNELAERFENK